MISAGGFKTFGEPAGHVAMPCATTAPLAFELRGLRQRPSGVTNLCSRVLPPSLSLASQPVKSCPQQIPDLHSNPTLPPPAPPPPRLHAGGQRVGQDQRCGDGGQPEAQQGGGTQTSPQPACGASSFRRGGEGCVYSRVCPACCYSCIDCKAHKASGSP
jgi:hypothetical protein